MYRIGQKVICVNASLDYKGISTNLIEKKIYVIEQICTDMFGIGLVVAGAYSWHPSKAYRATRFRPIVEHKTDISIFTEMLRPVKERA
jgi:hypothetical protein